LKLPSGLKIRSLEVKPEKVKVFTPESDEMDKKAVWQRIVITLKDLKLVLLIWQHVPCCSAIVGIFIFAEIFA
jgi:hypothetical protein